MKSTQKYDIMGNIINSSLTIDTFGIVDDFAGIPGDETEINAIYVLEKGNWCECSGAPFRKTI